MRLPLLSTGCIFSKARPQNRPSDWHVRDTLLPALRAIAAAPASVATSGVALFRFLHGHVVEIRHLRMSSLDASEMPLHLEAIFQFAFRDPFLQPTQSFFDSDCKAAANGFLLLFPPRCETQDVGLFPTRNGDVLDLYIRSNLLKIFFQ